MIWTQSHVDVTDEPKLIALLDSFTVLVLDWAGLFVRSRG